MTHTPERLAELVESINYGGDIGDEKLTPEQCEIAFDWGWTHAVLTPYGVFLEIHNTGWMLVETEEEAREWAEEADRK